MPVMTATTPVTNGTQPRTPLTRLVIAHAFGLGLVRERRTRDRRACRSARNPAGSCARAAQRAGIGTWRG
jgi:hypothetical protein